LIGLFFARYRLGGHYSTIGLDFCSLSRVVGRLDASPSTISRSTSFAIIKFTNWAPEYVYQSKVCTAVNKVDKFLKTEPSTLTLAHLGFRDASRSIRPPALLVRTDRRFRLWVSHSTRFVRPFVYSPRLYAMLSFHEHYVFVISEPNKARGEPSRAKQGLRRTLWAGASTSCNGSWNILARLLPSL